MRIYRLPAIATLVACVAASSAHGQSLLDGTSDFSLGLGASTLGFTVEPSLRLNERWGVRAPLGAGKVSLDDESNGQDYSGDLDLSGVGLLADYYPFASSGFRLSAGVFYSDYSADLQGDNVRIGQYSTDVTAQVRQRNDFAPALAVGYNGNLTERATMAFTIGGIFGDGFDVTARESTGLVPQALVDAEVADIRDDLQDFDVIPFIQLSVAWKF